MAALAGNGIIISHNRASFPIPKLQSQPFPSKFTNLPSTTKISTSFSAAIPRTHLSEVEVHPSNSSSTTWSEFARNISGEWDGHGADFTVQGNPIELPENVVPGAFREWDVKVFDWQTQCPTLADPEEPSLMYKSIKLLPTVGCEADAATRYTIDERNIGSVNNGVLGFGYESSGCYVAVWPIEHLGINKLELEHCLIDPGDRESRVRVVQTVRVDGAKMVLEGVRVFREQWYGPFRNGDQLGGCAIRDAAFASTAAMEASEVVGKWQGTAAVASFCNSATNLQEVLDAGTHKLARDESGLILLPRQLWCTLKESGDGETCSEVGWLLEHGHAITSRCIFSDTKKLKEISIWRESTALEGV